MYACGMSKRIWNTTSSSAIRSLMSAGAKMGEASFLTP